jgi:hypothetical protein
MWVDGARPCMLTMVPCPCHQVSDAMGLINIRDRVWHLQPCSAKTGEGLQKGMEWLVANVSK